MHALQPSPPSSLALPIRILVQPLCLGALARTWWGGGEGGRAESKPRSLKASHSQEVCIVGGVEQLWILPLPPAALALQGSRSRGSPAAGARTGRGGCRLSSQPFTPRQPSRGRSPAHTSACTHPTAQTARPCSAHASPPLACQTRAPAHPHARCAAQPAACPPRCAAACAGAGCPRRQTGRRRRRAACAGGQDWGGGGHIHERSGVCWVLAGAHWRHCRGTSQPHCCLIPCSAHCPAKTTYPPLPRKKQKRIQPHPTHHTPCRTGWLVLHRRCARSCMRRPNEPSSNLRVWRMSGSAGTAVREVSSCCGVAGGALLVCSQARWLQRSGMLGTKRKGQRSNRTKKEPHSTPPFMPPPPCPLPHAHSPMPTPSRAHLQRK